MCLQGNTANAQSVNLIGGTHQRWAGGICCRHGNTYNIQLKIVQGKTPVVLDSIRLNGYCISIAKYNPKKNRRGETSKISIIENLVFDDNNSNYNPRCYDPDKRGISFTYYIKGELKSMDLTPYIRELDFIGYP